MNRLFLRIFLRVLLLLSLVAILFFTFMAPRLNARRNRIFVSTTAPQTRLMAQLLSEEIARGRDITALFERMAKGVAAPLALLDRSGLPLDAESLAKLDAGEVIVIGPVPTSVLWVRLDQGSKVLRMGPLTAETLFPEPLLAVIVILIGSLLLGIVYAFFRPLERRLARLTDTAAGMGQGRLDTRVPTTKDDEVGRLEKAFNRMADEIQQLVRARDELLRSVSHELRTPLQRMHFALENTHADDEKTRVDAAGRLERDVEELQGLVEELLTYARFKDAPGIEFSKLNVNEVVIEIVESHAPLGPSVVLSAPAHLPLIGSVEPKLFRRALSNLVVNGIHHARSRVEVRTTRQDDMIFIDVHDDGPGIPAAEQHRIFEPFRRGDAQRSHYRGYGLGLAIVKSIAERHGGHVDVATSELGGARFRLGVPWAA